MAQISKREARIERQNQIALRREQKAARLKNNLEQVVRQEKKPRIGENPGSIFRMLVRWTCDDPDIEECWSWGVPRQWTDDEWQEIILPKLNEFSRLSWGEIDSFSSDTGHKLHHSQDVSTICEEAQYRLLEVGKYQDTIFRFRLGNLPRLWGIRIADEFSVLWFDPTHQIYPVN